MKYAPAQMYETTIQSNDTQSAMFFCTVPARSLPEDTFVLEGSQGYRKLPPHEYLMEELNVRGLFEISRSELKSAVSALLTGLPDLYAPVFNTSWLASRQKMLRDLTDTGAAGYLSKAQIEFAAHLVTQPVIPFESSPLSAVSLDKLLMRASGAGIGGYIGYVIAGATPLLLITVPAGMIICGAASGIARGLEDGLRTRIKSLMTRSRRAPRKKSRSKR